MTLCAVCELPISPEESFGQAMEGRHQHMHSDTCIRLLRAELAEAKAQMQGELWNLSQQNAALREAAEIASQLESLINAQSPPNYRQDNAPTTPVEKLQWLLDRFSALREDKERLVEALERCEAHFGDPANGSLLGIRAASALAKKARPK